MPPRRKTTTVEALLERGNRMLAASGTTPGFREGVAAFLEGVLHDTDNYRGFNYLSTEWLDMTDPEQQPDPSAPTLRKGYDETRRFYYRSA